MKQLALLAGFLWCFLTISAQEKTLLLSIKGEGINTSYLFGTVHLIDDSVFYFPSKLEKTLAKTDLLVLEIDNITDKTKAQQLLLLDSGNVFDLFTKEQADSVVHWGSRLSGMKPDMFRKSFSGMKPFVLMQLSLQASMNARSRSYEMELISKARSNKQSVKGLETMESQFAIFDSLPQALVVEMVMEGIRHPETAEQSQRELVKLYSEKDVEGLAKLIEESEELTGTTEKLLYERNRNWIPVMTDYMRENSCFFAVGAGHLGGEKGVIQLLINAGYTITPIHY